MDFILVLYYYLPQLNKIYIKIILSKIYMRNVKIKIYIYEKNILISQYISTFIGP
jgi:hypothetical protein